MCSKGTIPALKDYDMLIATMDFASVTGIAISAFGAIVTTIMTAYATYKKINKEYSLDEMNTLKKEKEQLEKDKIDLETRIAKLEKELENSDKELEKYRNSLLDMNAKWIEAVSKIGEKQRTIEKLEQNTPLPPQKSIEHDK